MPRRPPRPTLFPYTTLFRSEPAARSHSARWAVGAGARACLSSGHHPPAVSAGTRGHLDRDPASTGGGRSEEHTSELQSRRDLVCRLLLEKKKEKKRTDQDTD